MFSTRRRTKKVGGSNTARRKNHRATPSLLYLGHSWPALLIETLILIFILLVDVSCTCNENHTKRGATRQVRSTSIGVAETTPPNPVQILLANANRASYGQPWLGHQADSIGSSWVYPDDDSVSSVTLTPAPVDNKPTTIIPTNVTSTTSQTNSQAHQNSHHTHAQNIHQVIRPYQVSPNTTTSNIHPLLIYSIRYEIRGYEINPSSTRSSTSHAQPQPQQPAQQSSSAPPAFSNDFSQTPGSQTGAMKHSKTLIGGLKNTIGLDFFYDQKETQVFWTDVGEERIYRGVLSNGIISNVEIVIQTGATTAESLAVDWVGHNLYWVESTHLDHIEVSNMNGTSRRTLLAGDMESPRAIALDPRYGLLFWTDWDKKYPRIERATMSGEERRVLVDISEVKGGWPNGLTLDYDQLRVYWIDANSDSIHVVDYEGRGHQTVLRKIKSLGHPFSITLFQNNLFWTDWKTNSVTSANKLNGSDVHEVQRVNTRLFDIKVLHPSRQPPLEDHLNSCHQNNGNCSHLCLLTTNHERRCQCPHLMRLASDRLTCEQNERFLLIGKANEIRAVDLQEPLHSIMTPISVPKVFNPRQFEFDSSSKSIFWADAQTSEVKRAQVNGSAIDTIMDVVIEAPSGLALDWVSGNIYVTSASQHRLPGKIFVSKLTGEYISVLMDYSHGILSPKSIAVHPSLGLLYCSDETADGKPLIFVASMDGRNKRTIASRLNNPRLDNPTSLTIDYQLNRLYWVNQLVVGAPEGSSIQYYDIGADKIVSILDESQVPPADRLNPSLVGVDGDHLILAGRVPQEALFRAPRGDLAARKPLRTQSLERLQSVRVYDGPLQAGAAVGPCGANNGGCSQLCLPAGGQQRTCTCTIGYSVDVANETQCLGREQFLLFSHNLGLRGISLEPNSAPDDYFLPPIHKAFRASSIDFVHRDNLIYWVDNEEGSISRIRRDTTNHQLVVQGLESEESIALDWVAGNVYWLSPYYDVIEVARLDGSKRYVVVSGDMDKPNGIAVNPLVGYLVWSDVGSVPRIETAKLDGSERRTIVSSELARVDDLAIDFADNFIYWLDSTSATIERVREDGSQRQVVFRSHSNQAAQSQLVSIALHQEHLYVADSVLFTGSISRLDKNKPSSNAPQLVQVNLGDGIRDMTIYGRQPMPRPEDNPCAHQNGGCQDLCLFAGKRGRRQCTCSHGQLDADGVSCKAHERFLAFSHQTRIDTLQADSKLGNSPYPAISFESAKTSIVSLTVDYSLQRLIYSELNKKQICSLSFSGTDRRVLVENQERVEGIAFAAEQLYWTSCFDKTISRLNTSSLGLAPKTGSQVEKLVRLGELDRPRGIAIDHCTGYVYWTNWNEHQPAIQRASPSTGYQVESIIKSDIKIPNGIAIDHKMRKLYWCDARLDKIELADMDGSHRLILSRAEPQHPFALAICDNYVFWTDWLAKGVYRADKFTGESRTQMKKLSQRPMGIAVASPDSGATSSCPVNQCSQHNGGCPPGHTCIAHTWSAKSGRPTIECRPSSLAHEVVIPHPRCKHSRDGSSACDHSSYHDILLDSIERYNTNRYNLTDLLDSNIRDATGGVESPRGSLDPLAAAAHARVIPRPTGSPSSSSATSETVRTLIPINNGTHPPPAAAAAAAAAAAINNATNNQPIVQHSTTTTAIFVQPTTPPPSIPMTTSTTSTTTTAVWPPNSSVAAPQQVTAPSGNMATAASTSNSQEPQSAAAANSSASTTLAPCQIVPAALQTTTDSSAADCKQTAWFRCYLSDKPADCISPERRCDGIYDCPSKEDENDCYLSKRGPYNPRRDNNWHRYVTLILVILAAALAAVFLVFGTRGRRGRWFVGGANFNHRRMFDEAATGTNIEISNPMFDDDNDTNNLTSHCAFSIDLNERTTNFSNPLYERQVLLMGDKRPPAPPPASG